ncbi:transcriptional regulator [Vagococcus penaei]|uniref:Transcriptional regulator n=1 Tax=Vagococcus penaei TaxID=633807 RepID=A0A1Q2D3W6_9ENTE|nr:metalloregulator ArsR/SmtB family transcription factor [Vagococcus penaei]AQP52977.1 transcriptional regulator [Vagococcus penaei]RSU02563.1 transcriptional regulator [Vagococcus penaei]
MGFNDVTEEQVKQIGRFYKTLSDPTRVNILLALAASKELNVTALTDHLGMEQSAVSHQLKLLRDHRIVKPRKEGKTVFYSIDDHHVMDILTQTFKHLAHH